MTETLCYDEGKPQVLFQYWAGLNGTLYRDPNRVTCLFESLIELLVEKRYRKANEVVPKLLLAVANEMGGLTQMELMEEIHLVCSMGAKKYGLSNYKHGTQFSRRCNSAARHILYYFVNGEVFDKESGLHHMIHLVANVLIVCSWCKSMETRKKYNDLKEYLNERR